MNFHVESLGEQYSVITTSEGCSSVMVNQRGKTLPEESGGEEFILTQPTWCESLTVRSRELFELVSLESSVVKPNCSRPASVRTTVTLGFLFKLS